MLQYEIRKDEKIVEVLANHYKTFKAENFCDDLELANVEQLCWLYEKTGDVFFLKVAEKAYELFKSDINYRNRAEGGIAKDIQFASERTPDNHGVVYLELVKIPAILYTVTGNKEYLKEAEHGISKMEKHHMLVSGLPSTTEHFKGVSELAGYEICNTAVLPYTYGHILRANGDATLADKIEKAVFNAGIGSVTEDFKAHQYFSSPNQVLSTSTSNPYGHHPARMAYMPGHDVECCTGNVNRFMPYYVEQMWMRSPHNGLVASLFGPSQVNAKVGFGNKPVTIFEETNYPFSEEITFKIKTEELVRFPFHIRIPKWCNQAELFINGKKQNKKLQPGTFCVLDREYSDGDIVRLSVPMEIKTTQWPNNGIAVERGPIVYSLPIKHKANTFDNGGKSTSDFPAWEYNPVSEWNYAADFKVRDIEIVDHGNTGYPWSLKSYPISLKVPVKRVKNWKISKVHDHHLNRSVPKTPEFPEKLELEKKKVMIELIPFGCSLLRLTIFPDANIE
ncbi:beta-L-arabinofuranosidase domain-containing protein [Marinilabilia rubra]|nr:beta-L-arabinofuranosidase domain-containing protein [Marinilabilia rubra]